MIEVFRVFIFVSCSFSVPLARWHNIIGVSSPKVLPGQWRIHVFLSLFLCWGLDGRIWSVSWFSFVPDTHTYCLLDNESWFWAWPYPTLLWAWRYPIFLWSDSFFGYEYILLGLWTCLDFLWFNLITLFDFVLTKECSYCFHLIRYYVCLCGWGGGQRNEFWPERVSNPQQEITWRIKGSWLYSLVEIEYSWNGVSSLWTEYLKLEMMVTSTSFNIVEPWQSAEGIKVRFKNKRVILPYAV